MAIAFDYRPLRNGWITGIRASCNIVSAVAASTVTFKVYKNGVDTGLSVQVSGASTGLKHAYSSVNIGAYQFSAGDYLEISMDISGSGPTVDTAIAMLQISEQYDFSPSTAWTDDKMYLRFPAPSRDLTIAVW